MAGLLLNLIMGFAFYRFYPVSEGLIQATTDVDISLSGDTLIVKAMCHSPFGIYTESLDRDALQNGEDFFGLVLTQNKNTGYFFFLNAMGVKQDGIISQRSSPKLRWDFVWDVRVEKVSDTLWLAEFFIPLGQMRMRPEGDSLILYANFIRSVKLEGVGNFEMGSLVPIRGVNFYDLQFTERFAFPYEKKNWDLRVINEPYLAVYRDEETYFSSGGDVSFNTGGGNLALTVNPEYATVEADVEQFNLDRREMIYYPEKRPFFMSGFELWNTPFKVLYTRRLQDIDVGVKMNYNSRKVGVNLFFVQEKDPTMFNISRKRMTGGIRSLYYTNFAEIGGFYLNSRDSFEVKGVDLLFFLPSDLRLSTQFTSDKKGRSDIFVQLTRSVSPGLSMDGGFERLDSLEINTAFLPYPKFIQMGWLYLSYHILREKNLMPYLESGVGGSYAQFLDGTLFENNGSIWVSFGLLRNLSVTYNFIPSRRYDPLSDTIFDNTLHYVNLHYAPLDEHQIVMDFQRGNYFGGPQNYYSLSYTFRGKKLLLGSGYAYYEEPEFAQRRYYIKAKWNVSQKVRLRFFAQHSDISKEDYISFMSEYEFNPGTSVYFVINRLKSQEGYSDTKLMIKFKSYFSVM